MRLRTLRTGPRAVGADLLLVPVAEGEARAALRRIGPRGGAALGRRLRATGFRGRPDEVLVHHGATALALLGMGPAPVGLDAWRRAGARGRQEAERQRTPRVAAYLGDAEPSPEWLAAFAEGFLLAGYRFTRYTSDPERRGRVHNLTLVGEALPRPR